MHPVLHEGGNDHDHDPERAYDHSGVGEARAGAVVQEEQYRADHRHHEADPDTKPAAGFLLTPIGGDAFAW